MIRVTIGRNLERKNVIVEESTTIRQVLEDNDIDYGTVTMNLDGVTLRPGDFDSTFEEFGITDHCFLLGVTKADNA